MGSAKKTAVVVQPREVSLEDMADGLRKRIGHRKVLTKEDLLAELEWLYGDDYVLEDDSGSVTILVPAGHERILGKAARAMCGILRVRRVDIQGVASSSTTTPQPTG